MVVATQNPFEFEGHITCPENQLDRFLLKVAVGYPDRAAEHKILTTQPGRSSLNELPAVASTVQDVIDLQDAAPQVKMDTAIVDYILDLIEATRHDDQLHLGVSRVELGG